MSLLMLMLTLLLVVLQCSSHVQYTSAVSSDEQAESLCKFYAGTNMDRIRLYNSSWACYPTNGTAVANANPCLQPVWEGVSCDSSSQRVTRLMLNASGIRGTISPHLCNLTSLTYANFNKNNFYSTIPESISLLTNLTYLDFWTNNLTSCIPGQLGALTKLKYLDVSYNGFRCHFPPQLSSLTNLQYLYMENNKITSYIPPVVASLSSLLVLYLDFNSLTSSIPVDAISTLSNLQVLGLGNNYLSGSLPSQFGVLNQLQFLSLQANSFSSSIPSQYSNLTKLYFLSIQENSITSTIPLSLSTLTGLKYILLSTNHLSGPLEQAIFGQFSFLQELQAAGNMLTGPVAPCFGSMQKLKSFFIGHNNFHGSLPFFINGMTRIVDFLVNDNQLTGSIDSILGNDSGGIGDNITLVNVDLSNNRFTGSIPDYFFGPRLESIAAISNCADTYLSDAICRSANLTSVALDGIASATACRTSIWPHLKPYMLKSRSYSIPKCIFALQQLQTLHLSGNNYYGDLETIDQLGSQMVDLSLSHNFLKGSIPEIFWRNRNWQTFDLSHNRFTGEIGYDGVFASTLALQVNRLSGNLPSSVINSRSPNEVNVLRGNIFYCKTSHRGIYLPRNDPDFLKYSCDSEYLYFTFIVAGGLIFCFVVATVAIYVAPTDYLVALKRRVEIAVSDAMQSFKVQTRHMSTRSFRPLTSRFQSFSAALKQLDDSSSKSNPNNPSPSLNLKITSDSNESDKGLLSLDVVFDNIRLLFTVSTGTNLLILLPLYVIFHFVLPNRYTNGYGWVLSPAFLAGDVIPYIMLVVVILFASLIYFLIEYIFSNYGQFLLERASSGETRRDKLLHYLSLAIFVLVNVFFMCIVNGFYVYSTIYFHSDTLLFVAVFISQVKLIWNDFIMSRLLNFINNRILYRFGYARKHVYLGTQQRREMKTLLLLYTVNNVVIPCLSTVLISPRCFFYSFFQAESVHTSYSFKICELFYITTTQFVCTKYQQVSIASSYEPPFEYLFSCSSEVVQVYSPLFLLMYTSVAFLDPLKTLVLLMVNDHINSKHPTNPDPTSSSRPSSSSSSSNNNNNNRRTKLGFDAWLLRGVEVLLNRGLRPSLLESDFRSEKEEAKVEIELSTTKLRMISPIQEEEKEEEKGEGEGVGGNITSVVSALHETVDTCMISSVEPADIENKQQHLKVTPAPPSTLSPASLSSSPSSLPDLNDSSVGNFFVFDKTKFISCCLTDYVILITFGLLYPPLSVVILIAVFSRTYSHQLIIGRLALELKRRGFKNKLLLLERDCSGMGRLYLRSKKYIFPYPFIFLSLFIYDFFGDISVGAPLTFTCILLAMPYFLYLVKIAIIYITEKRDKGVKYIGDEDD